MGGMLYTNCEVGDITVEMMVDTGAQMSSISSSLAHRANLMSSLDRFTLDRLGEAHGVGRAAILGKLRNVPVTMGHAEFALDFSVLEMDRTLLLLGVDQMRRFKCVVDLERRCLVFGGSGGLEVPFMLHAPRQVFTRV